MAASHPPSTVPFEEDEKDPTIWFLDHSYLESMFHMFKKVNAKERILGWYSTGPRLREADLDINDLMSQFCDDPVLVICDIQVAAMILFFVSTCCLCTRPPPQPREMGLPTVAYFAKEDVREDGTQKSQKVFANVPTEVGATEAEEIGAC